MQEGTARVQHARVLQTLSFGAVKEGDVRFDAGSSGVDGLVQAAADVGIRAAIGPSLTDLWHDSSSRLVRQADADELLANASAFVGRYDGAGQGCIRALVSAVQTMAADVSLVAHANDETGADRDRGVVIDTGLGREFEHSAAGYQQIARLGFSRGA